MFFADRASKHSPKKNSPFKLLYNREPVLPIDVKYKLSSTEDSDELFDKDIFDAVLVSFNIIRKEVYRQAGENMQSPKETVR